MDRVPLIIIVGADKGGVGKTTVARALMDYAHARGAQVRAFDTEPEEGVLRRFFPTAESLDPTVVSDQMRVIDAAKADAITLVDARAGLLSKVLKAFHRIDLMEDVRLGRLRLLVLHVVDSTVASSAEVPKVVAAMQGASLVRVNNRMKDNAVFSPSEAREVVIEIPNLPEEACAAVDKANAPFARFVENTGNSRALRGHIRAWEAEVFSAFDAGGIGDMVEGKR